MVEFFRNWIINIVTVIIFIVFIETIIPSEKFKKYVKLATGLVLMIVIINPIVTMMNKAHNIDTLAVQSFNEFDKSDMTRQFDKLEDAQSVQILNIYRTNLTEQVKEQILSVKGIGDADVEVWIDEDQKSKSFGSILKIDAVVNGQKNPVSVRGNVQAVDVNVEHKNAVPDEMIIQVKEKLALTYEMPSEKIILKTQKSGG